MCNQGKYTHCEEMVVELIFHVMLASHQKYFIVFLLFLDIKQGMVIITCSWEKSGDQLLQETVRISVSQMSLNDCSFRLFVEPITGIPYEHDEQLTTRWRSWLSVSRSIWSSRFGTRMVMDLCPRLSAAPLLLAYHFHNLKYNDNKPEANLEKESVHDKELLSTRIAVAGSKLWILAMKIYDSKTKYANHSHEWHTATDKVSI